MSKEPASTSQNGAVIEVLRAAFHAARTQYYAESTKTWQIIGNGSVLDKAALEIQNRREQDAYEHYCALRRKFTDANRRGDVVA